MDLMALTRHSSPLPLDQHTIAELSLPVYVHEARLLFLSRGAVPMLPRPARYLSKEEHQCVIFPLLTATSLGRLCLVLHEIVECRRGWEPRR